MITPYPVKLCLLGAALLACTGPARAEEHAGTKAGAKAGANVAANVTATYAFYKRLHERLLAGEPRKALEDALPSLDAKMAKAARVSQQRWSYSQNYDEMKKAEILEQAVLKSLGIPFEEKSGIAHVPAGLMHSYGYLFSQLRTDFGLKGKRWIESRIDERLGLPAAEFSPLAKGEFLTQLTRCLDRLLAGQNKQARVMGSLEEHVSWQKPNGRLAAGAVRTTLTTLPTLPDLTTSDVSLLVYEVKLPGDRWRYVTAFPVEQGFADKLMATKAAADAAFVPRYNLYVDPDWKVIKHATAGFRPKNP